MRWTGRSCRARRADPCCLLALPSCSSTSRGCGRTQPWSIYETAEMRFWFLLTSVLSDKHSQGTSFCELVVNFPSKWVLKPSRTKRGEDELAVFVQGCCLGCSALSPISATCSNLGRAQTFRLGLCFEMAPCFLNGSSPSSPSLISVSPVEALCYKFSCFAQGCQ